MNERREKAIAERILKTIEKYSINDVIPDLPEQFRKGLLIIRDEKKFDLTKDLIALIIEMKDGRQDTGDKGHTGGGLHQT